VSPTARRSASPRQRWSKRKTIQQGRLYRADDNGPGVEIDPAAFGGRDEEGWGRAYESFRRLNEEALSGLEVTSDFESTTRGPVLTLRPGGKAGAVPLRSGTTGHVVAGYIVRPRFGWSGVGSILAETGWQSAPNILSMPLVPGSGREVPPWVLAGPVIARLRALLDQLKRGFDFREATLTSPRGPIQWARYLRESLPTGKWHHIPSRFPDLSSDPILRGAIKWTLERVLQELAIVAGADRVALGLSDDANKLLERLSDVVRVYPRPELLGRMTSGDPLLQQTVRCGLDAIGWVRDERGLGGGRQMDGLAWALPLNQLWEDHVAAIVKEQVRQQGGVMRSGRRGETVESLHWSNSSHRSLGHLAPDIVVTRASSVWVVDAKYKAHFAEIDEGGWRRIADDIRESHRADVHQVLAYSTLFDAPEITATLAYPLRLDTWQSLSERGLDRTAADLYAGSRHVRLELWGLPFEVIRPDQRTRSARVFYDPA
jgi:hypothetical protein